MRYIVSAYISLIVIAGLSGGSQAATQTAWGLAFGLGPVIAAGEAKK